MILHVVALDDVPQSLEQGRARRRAPDLKNTLPHVAVLDDLRERDYNGPCTSYALEAKIVCTFDQTTCTDCATGQEFAGGWDRSEGWSIMHDIVDYRLLEDGSVCTIDF